MNFWWFKTKDRIKSILSLVNTRHIPPCHPIGRHFRLYGGTINFCSRDKRDTGYWDENGMLDNAFMLELGHRKGRDFRVQSYKLGSGPTVDICPTCRCCVPIALIDNPRLILNSDAPLWARLMVAWWQKTGRVPGPRLHHRLFT